MIRGVWRALQPLLPARSPLYARLLAVESFVAGLLEAVLLVLVVSVSLTVADGADAVDLSLPLLGELDVAVAPGLVIAGAAGLLMLAIHVHAARLSARLASDVLRTARDRAVSAFARASYSRQAADREGALQETISTLSSQTALLVTRLSVFGAGAMGLVSLLLAAVVVDPVVTLIALCLGALLFVVLRPVGRLTRRRSRGFVQKNSAFTERISEWGALAMELRTFGVEEVEARRLSDQNRVTAGALARTRFVGRVGTELYRDLAILFLVGAVTGLHLIGDVNIAAVGAVVLLVVRSLSYAQMTNTALQSVNELSPNLHSLLARIDSLEAAAEPVGHRSIERVARVELNDVGYDYEDGRVGIDRVTIDMAAGEVLGVIGPSGGGKSTLVQVLLRLRQPTRGTVTVSGVAYEEIEPACWHRLVAVVPQEPKLFQGTVADNIAFLRADVTRERVEHAAAAAHVLEDIRRLPEGFDTKLGPRGAGLSGGQKQRIAIARALAGEPQLLVLDEPTSALDVRSEQLLQHTVEELKGRITLVIVAHRLTTLACVDRVVALEDGRVKVIGTLDQALAQVSFDKDIQLVTIGEDGPERK